MIRGHKAEQFMDDLGDGDKSQHRKIPQNQNAKNRLSVRICFVICDPSGMNVTINL